MVERKAEYVITPRMHALHRAQQVSRLAAERDAKRAKLRKMLDREFDEKILERYGVPRDDPRYPMVYKAVFDAGMRGMNVQDPKVSNAVATKALAAHARTQSRETTDVVYYIEVGDLIKVGTTSDINRRLQAYPPNAIVLATETGSYARETERVEEFAEYLAGRREWFHRGPRLMAHIDALKASTSAE